jgi:hypothetical protein
MADPSAFDELAFLKSVAPAQGGGKVPAPGAAARAKLATPPEAGTFNDISLPDQTTAPAKAGSGSVPTEQVKTLKCSECGSMNYPTEWYCERCGGELAAM